MNRRHIGAVLVLLGVATVALSASGQSGIYAVIEKVTVEPANGPAERVQVWGAFALMERFRDGFTSYVYRKPVRGYMYFRLPTGQPNIDNARKEWADLASVAGKKQAVAFGYWDQYRGDSMPTVRLADAKPENPDPYYMDIGLTKLSSATAGVVADLLKLIEGR